MAGLLSDQIQMPTTVRIERMSRETFRMIYDNNPDHYLDIIHYQKTKPASKSEVEKLKKALRKDLLGEQCRICLCKYKRSDKALSMPCKHNFHEICLKKWLEKSNFCPLCKFELKTDNEMYEFYREEFIHRRPRENNIAEN